MQYSEADIKTRIKTRLGGGRRIIEFAEQGASGEYDSLSECIQQALDLFNAYVSRTETGHLAAVADIQKVVDLADDPDLLRVVRVDFARPQTTFPGVTEDPFTLTTKLQGGLVGGYGGVRGRMAPAGRIGYEDIAFWQQHREAIGRISGTEPEWLWDENNRKLALYMPNGPYDVTYLKSYPHTLASLPRNYESLFLKAVEGYARQLLADIRGKFGQQVPGPTGGTETDADQLRSRGQDLVREVEEHMRRLPLLAGIEFG